MTSSAASEARPTIPSLATTALLGRTGLRVTPLCLGTMTFGTEWGWGVGEDVAHALLDRYLEAGGNFLDSADLYTKGSSERMVGNWIKERGARDKVVLATKFTFDAQKGNANSGGNGRKNILRAIEGSLKRLQTDYIDLYWLHAWDGVTPMEEVLRTLDDLVRAGKVRAVGLSDVPAWYAARAVTLCEWRGWERPAALQLEYSLLERSIEREHIPFAVEHSVGVTPWSPLGAGMLTGKLSRGSDTPVQGQGRLKTAEKSAVYQRYFAEKNWRVVETLKEVAASLSRTPAQVAINWVTRRPGVSSTILGATSMAQLEENLHALDFDLPADAVARLDAATALELVHPYAFFLATARNGMTGGVPVHKEPRTFRG